MHYQIELSHAEEKSLVGFRYFWAKQVTGFKSSVHCAQCLKGEYVNDLGRHTNCGIRKGETDAPFLYVCGVSSPYCWENNFHLAVKLTGNPKDFATLNTYNKFAVKITGGLRYNFDVYAALENYGDKSERHLNCRNYQFGAQAFPR